MLDDDMTIKELLEHRSRCESAILNELLKFKEHTGFNPTYITLGLDAKGNPERIDVTIQLENLY